MKKSLIIFGIIVLLFPLMLMSQDYIGAGKCKMCHKSAKQGEQFPKWEAAKHSKAFEALSSANAAATAKAMGVTGTPAESPECLKCHGPVEAFKTEGVTCENCHGPGSDYKKMSVMKDHAKSVAAGMKEYGSPDAIKTLCLTCHGDAHGTTFDFDASWAKIKHPVPEK